MLLKARCPVKSRKIRNEGGKYNLMKNVKCEGNVRKQVQFFSSSSGYSNLLAICNDVSG